MTECAAFVFHLGFTLFDSVIKFQVHVEYILTLVFIYESSVTSHKHVDSNERCTFL